MVCQFIYLDYVKATFGNNRQLHDKQKTLLAEATFLMNSFPLEHSV